MGISTFLGYVAAASAIASSAKSFLDDDGGGDTTVTSENQVSPASWKSLGKGSDYLWMDYVDEMFGGNSEANIEAKIAKLPADQQSRLRSINASIEEYQTNLDNDMNTWKVRGWGDEEAWSKHPNVVASKGILENLKKQRAEEFPELYGPDALKDDLSLKDKMGANYEAQEQAGLDYIDAMGGVGDEYLRSNRYNTSTYNAALDDISRDASTPYAQVAIGGNPFGVVSKRQLALADVLQGLAGKKYDAGGSLAQKEYDIGAGDANRRFTQGMNFTPYGADVQYLDKLWPMVSQLQGYRFQTPSSVQTATASSNPSFAEQMQAAGQFTQTLPELVRGIQSLFGTNNANYSSGGNGDWTHGLAF